MTMALHRAPTCSPAAAAAVETSRQDRERIEGELEPRSIAALERTKSLLARNHFMDVAQAILKGA